MRHLAEVVDFEVLLGGDEELLAREGPSALVARDRALAADLPAGSPHRRLRRWVALRRRTAGELPGPRARSLVVLLAWGLGILGAALGAGAGAALLAYDGQDPVNVLAWLLYTALLPLLLALMLGIGLLLPRGWLAWGGAAQSLLAAVIEPLLRRLPGGARWGAVVFGRAERGSARLERWLLVGLTQIFSIGFLGAALLTLLVKVSITDLAFSWSTTLDLDDAAVTRMVHTLSWPWKDVLPGAVPGAEAVRASNYRRFVKRFRDTERRTAVQTAIGARWWKLCAASVVMYGILPRIALLLLARWRWRAALRSWPDLDRPDVRVLVERLDGGGAGTFRARRPQSPTPDPASEPSAPAAAAAPSTPATAEEAGLVVAWGSAATDLAGAAAALDLEAAAVRSAGADLDLSAERAVLEEAARVGGPVTVLMPLAEPPIEDVLGFLRELRSVAPRVTVVALAREGEAWRASGPDAVWRKALTRVQGVEAAEP